MPRKKNTRKSATKSAVNTDTLRRSLPQGPKLNSGSPEPSQRRYRPAVRPDKFPGRLGGR